MKISTTQLRELILEEINSFLKEETEQQQRTTAIGQISGILSRLHNTNINAQDVLNSSKEKYENEVATQKPKSMSSDDMSTADPIGNRKEKKWSDADHDKQEKIAQGLAKDNPDMPKDEKMAIAGAQVNREKRKRNK